MAIKAGFMQDDLLKFRIKQDREYVSSMDEIQERYLKEMKAL